MNWLYELAAVFTVIVYFETVFGWVKNFFAARAENRKRQMQYAVARRVAAQRKVWLMRRRAEVDAARAHDPAMG